MTVFKRQNTETPTKHRRQPPWSAIFRGMHVLRDAGMGNKAAYRALKVAVIPVSTDENGDAVFRSTSAPVGADGGRFVACDGATTDAER
jgi:hypothetical protein